MVFLRSVATLLLVVVLFIATVAAYSPQYTGPQYQQKVGYAKLWALAGNMNGTDSREPFGWYSKIRMGELFMESLNKTFEYVGDDMPAQGVFGTEKRPKLLHSVGVIAQARWIDLGNHNYTGIFRGGDENCFIRLSLAKPPTLSVNVPGISMKFLRDGQKSANVMAMYNILGQPEANFFAHDLTNHAPDFDVDNAVVDMETRLLVNAFKKASAWGKMVGLSDMATYNATGARAFEPVFPYRLVFHPTTNYHTMFINQAGSDDPTLWAAQLNSGLRMGTVLYEVYVENTPGSAITGPIAQVMLKENAHYSSYGDSDLYFQHQRMEDDFALRPEWAAPASFIEEQQRAFTPWSNPDLPFN